MSNFNARADLHRTEMRPIKFGQKIVPSPRYLRSDSVTDCVNAVMAKREPDRVLYSMTVPLEAGFGKDTLDYWDIQAISKRPDFPKEADDIRAARNQSV
jgi:hypothetical protein